MHNSRSLELGLLVDSHLQPAWVRSALQAVIDANLVSIVLVIKNTDRRSLFNKIWRNLPYALYYLYERVDSIIYKLVFRSSSDPFAPTDISDLASKSLWIKAEPGG